jgi:hypothetical protein
MTPCGIFVPKKPEPQGYSSAAFLCPFYEHFGYVKHKLNLLRFHYK